MTDDADLGADVVDLDGPFAQWLERELEIYLAHAGRDGTLQGFQEHVLKMAEANPNVGRIFMGDLAMVAFDDPTI
jgi:hypothetical protein